MQNTRTSQQLHRLHDAVLDIVRVINRPAGDELLIREAGIRLDRALFPLLVLIERYGPLGIVDLAGRVGRDHTTVSRQVARLVERGLVQRQASPADGRLRAAIATPAGQAMARRIDIARERLTRAALADWSTAEVDILVTTICRFAAAITSGPVGQPD